MPALEQVVIPDSPSPSTPTEPDYLAGLSNRLGIPDEVVPPVEEVKVVSEPAKVVPPVVDPVTPPPSRREEPAIRIENKTLKKQVEDYEKELADLRAKAARLPELETSVTEFKTLAERAAEEKKKLDEAYRNEAAAFPAELLDDLPEVQTAKQGFDAAARSLFPEYLSDLNDDSDPDVRMDFGALSPAQRSAVGGYIDQWEDMEYSSKDSPTVRAETQRALISLIAKTLKVNPAKFVTENFRGHEFDMLPKSHPVYQHLRASLKPFVEQRQRLNMAKEAARTQAKTSLSQVISTRVNNTKALFSNVGVGLSGEALDAALAKTPDSPVLKTMKLLQDHPDLMEELKTNMEHEATLNGVFRPHYDFVEDDPGERTAKAQAANLRIGRRAAFAPVAEPLMKALLRTQEKLAESERLRAAAEAEASKTRIQAEPGTEGYGDSTTSTDPDADEYMQRIERLAAQRTR